VRDVLLGVHKLDKQLLHVLDTEKACGTMEAVASGAEQ
jgi:hypothetical protein